MKAFWSQLGPQTQTAFVEPSALLNVKLTQVPLLAMQVW